MPVSASVSELVQLPFLLTDVDGLTPLSGVLDGAFAKVLIQDDSASALAVTVTEVGALGRYHVDFTPDGAGLWYVEIQYLDDFFACYVEVGPPPDDVVDAIVAGVWGDVLPGTFPAGSAGFQLGNLFKAVVAANLAAVVPGSTASIIHTAATQADDFYNGLQIIVCNAAGIVARRVTDYSLADGAFTLDSDLPFTPDDGDQVIVLGRLGEVAIDGDSAIAVKLCEVHTIMGLDPDAPLCISKTKQEAGGIVLKQTEVGKKLIVQRET